MHAVPASDPPAPRSGHWLPLLVLFIGLALTAAFAAWSWQRERSEELARFEAAVQELPDNQRDAVTMSRLMGLSYPQIAEQLGMTESAVRGLVARGLAALSSVIDEEGEES